MVQPNKTLFLAIPHHDVQYTNTLLNAKKYTWFVSNYVPTPKVAKERLTKPRIINQRKIYSWGSSVIKY